MSDFLQTMAASSADRAAAAGSPTASASAKPVVPLMLGKFDVIAEIKNRSPSAGDLTEVNDDHVQQALRYAEGGAAAISVLTEPTRFAGSLEHLEQIAAAVPEMPVMRKDFLVDPVQIIEVRNAGASGVLLITTMLDDDRLRQMLDQAFELDLFVLLESFDRADLERTSQLLEHAVYRDRADAGQLLAGVNTRNLRTLTVDSQRLEKLVPHLPAARCVAESGLRDAEDAAQVAALGYRLALVGTALMRSSDPASLITAMRAAGSARFAA